MPHSHNAAAAQKSFTEMNEAISLAKEAASMEEPFFPSRQGKRPKVVRFH